MMAPCSVKAKGSFLRPPQLEVANCNFKFLIRQLKQKIPREAREIAPHLLVQACGGNAVELGEIAVEQHLFVTDDEDAAGDALGGHERATDLRHGDCASASELGRDEAHSPPAAGSQAEPAGHLPHR
jgi:hypothetical protein